MSRTIRNLMPNTDVVKVKHSNGWGYYSVYINLNAYIAKCKEDGKEVHYLGKSNSEGAIEDNE